VTVVLVAATLTGAAAASTGAPEGVSPGEVDRIVEVGGPCPSFFWSAVPEAAAYELVVFRLPETPAEREAAELDLSPSDVVLSARVPGRAGAWQPSLDEALEPGAAFVWFVRAVLREEDGEVVEASEWSAGRFFEVAAAPSADQMRQALGVLQRWEAATGDGSRTLSADAVPVPAAVAAPAPAAVADSGSGSDHPKSVPTAAAAVRGSSADTTGEAYGVVGLSASPDGAGVAAANTAGGADLVLDGSADSQSDTRLSQSGIDRPSPTQQFFDIDNSGGGGIVVEIDGWPVLTRGSSLDAGMLASGTVPGGRLAGTYGNALALTNPGNAFTGSGADLTGVDAATLDGTDGAAYATDAEAAAMVAAHAASAAHDPRYYTKTQLNTAGAGGAVHWGNLVAVPAGFADGVDDNTTYNAGPGIVVDGDVIRVDPGAFHTRLSTLDSAGLVGEYTAVTIGADGLGLISYYDSTNGYLKVAHCNDTVCSSATTATIDSAGWVGGYTSIAIGGDGLGLISYHDFTNYDLKVAHCNNAACSSAAIATLDSAGTVGWFTSIAIGIDGLGLISYQDGFSHDLKVAHCNNAVCSSAMTTVIDSTGFVLGTTSVAIGADGLGLISYTDGNNGDIKVAHCSSVACTSATTVTIDSADFLGWYTSIAIGPDGIGLVSYRDGNNDDLKVARCSDFACSSATTATLDSAGNVGHYTAIAFGADGLALISYQDATNSDVKVARCSNVACSSATTAIVDSGGSDWFGGYTSIAIGADCLGLISYWDNTNEDLKVAHLGIGVP
jgi:hypothetical protein